VGHALKPKLAEIELSCKVAWHDLMERHEEHVGFDDELLLARRLNGGFDPE
jgi:hypothetical protein